MGIPSQRSSECAYLIITCEKFVALWKLEKCKRNKGLRAGKPELSVNGADFR